MYKLYVNYSNSVSRNEIETTYHETHDEAVKHRYSTYWGGCQILSWKISEVTGEEKNKAIEIIADRKKKEMIIEEANERNRRWKEQEKTRCYWDLKY